MKKSRRQLINEEKDITLKSIIYLTNKEELERINNEFFYPEQETMFLLKKSFYMGKSNITPASFKQWINELVKKK